jgi:hypothetical protein
MARAQVSPNFIVLLLLLKPKVSFWSQAVERALIKIHSVHTLGHFEKGGILAVLEKRMCFQKEVYGVPNGSIVVPVEYGCSDLR